MKSNGVKTKSRLTAQDCLFLGKHTFNSGALSRSLEWFEEAWYLAGVEGNKTVQQEKAQQFLDHAAKVVRAKPTMMDLQCLKISLVIAGMGKIQNMMELSIKILCLSIQLYMESNISGFKEGFSARIS